MINSGSEVSGQFPSGPEYKELFDQSRKMSQAGRSADALEILSQTEKLIEQNPNLTQFDRDLYLSRVHINRGITLKNIRSLEKSARCYEDAMNLLKKHPDKVSREICSAELNLAILRTHLKDRKKALSGFDRAEKIAREISGPDRDELLEKVITNKAQLHIEFHEIDQARDLLGKLVAGGAKGSDHERAARVSTQLGLMIVHRADEESDATLAKEHYQKAMQFFDDAIKIYEEVGLERDAICQTINKIQTLISLGRYRDARKKLSQIYNDAVEKKDYNIIASVGLKFLTISVRSDDKAEQEKWLQVALNSTKKMTSDARRDFLERLESHLRWIGGEDLIAHVQKEREQEI